MTNSDINKQNSISIAELLYLVFFAVMLTAKAVGLYEGQFLYNVVLVIGAGLFGIKMLLTKHSLLEYIVIILFLLLGGVVYFNSGEKSLLIFIAVMLGMKGVSAIRVFRVSSVIWVAVFIGMYVLSVIGVIPEKVYTLSRSGWPPILRHSLGYPHPNTLHVTYFILCMFVLFSLKDLSKKYNLALAIVLMMGNCYVFMYSLSRNGFFVTTLYLAISVYFKYRVQLSKLEKILIKCIFPFSALVMVVAPVVVKGKLFDILDVRFAGRFKFTRYFLTYQPMKLFGIRDIPLPANEYVIDSSYVYLLFKLGIVAYIMYFIAMILLINKLFEEKQRDELAVVLALTIGGINETYLFNQSFKNLIFIFLGAFLFEFLLRLRSGSNSFLTRETIGLSLGEKEIALPVGSSDYKRNIPVNIWFMSAFLFVMAGLSTTFVYVVFFPRPHDIYLPAYEITAGDGVETYLSLEEVRQLQKNGDIVRGYVDDTTPLYRMIRKGTVKVEYIRYIFSYGLWGASLVSVAFLLIWTARSKVRFLLRNRKIGDGYKENVLIVHNYYRIPGGEDVVVTNEKNLLEQHGHNVILYSRNNEEAGDHSFLQKIGLAFVSFFNIRTYKDICAIIEKEKIDVIHVHNTVALISPAVYLAGINCGIPVVQTVHNFRLVCPNGVCYVKDHVCERCLEHGLGQSLIYNCYRNSKLQTMVLVVAIKLQRALQTYKYINYICLTEFNKEKLLTVKQIREENVFIKPNFTTMEAEIIPYGNRNRQMIYAGRLEKIKGVDLLLQAWMKLGDKAPKLLICGSGELEEWCREYIQNNEITNIEMLGQISNSEVKQKVGESCAMLYPTQWYEGFPMAIAEAYTMGTPIIASDIGNVGNLVDDGISGVKFKSNSVIALAKAVEKFMEKPIKLPEEYLTKYTAEQNYVMLKGIYETVRRRML